MKAKTWGGATLVFALGLVTSACTTGDPSPKPLVITAFGPAQRVGDAPRTTELRWVVAGDLDGSTCRIDLDGDGTADEVRSPCPASGSVSATYANAGESHPTLTVEAAGGGTASATTSVYANAMSLQPGVVALADLAGFQSAEVANDIVKAKFTTTDPPAEIAVGSIVFSLSPTLYRRVLAVGWSDGTLTLATEQVGLGEVFQDGFLGYEPEDPALGSAASPTGLRSQWVWQNTGQPSVKTSLTLPGLILNDKKSGEPAAELLKTSIDVTSTLEKFRLEVVGTTVRSFDLATTLEYEGGGQVGFLRSITIADEDIASLGPVELGTPIGAVELTAKLKASLDIKVGVDSLAEAKFGQTFHTAYHYAQGDQGLAATNTSTHTASLRLLGKTVTVGEVDLGFKQSIDAALDGILHLEPYLEEDAKASIEVESTEVCLHPSISVSAGVDGWIGLGKLFRVPIFGAEAKVADELLNPPSCVDLGSGSSGGGTSGGSAGGSGTSSGASTCTSGADCIVPGPTCRLGRTTCTSSGPTCVLVAGPVAEGTPCGTDSYCHGGACTPVCHPACDASKACGSTDGCSGKCFGTCGAGELCDLGTLSCVSAETHPSLSASTMSGDAGAPVDLTCTLGSVGASHTVSFLALKTGSVVGLAQVKADASGKAVAHVTLDLAWKDDASHGGNVVIQCRDDDAPSPSVSTSSSVTVCVRGTCAAASASCGTLADGCGGTRTCPTCATPAPTCATGTTLRTYGAPACSSGACGAAPYTDAPCPNGCNAGACKACADECSLGQSRCTSNGLVQDCADLGAGCLQWKAPAACPSGQTCDATTSTTCDGPPAAPSLLAPADGSAAASPVTLSWSAVSGAYRYHALVCTDPALASGCIDPDGGMPGVEPAPGATTMQVTVGTGTWYWAVRAIRTNDLGGWGPFSATRSFGVSCVPACGGRQCGADGCGGSCGTCGAGTSCDAPTGTCKSTAPTCPAAADCSGRACGPDPVCSTSCGTCPGTQSCSSAGQCLACSPSSLYCSGLDIRQCSSDGTYSTFVQTCPWSCSGGTCVPQCTTDSNCLTTEYCLAGACTADGCPQGQLYCGTNPNDVWQCNANGSGGSFVKTCPFGCSAGVCKPQCTDDSGCAIGQYCLSGACQTDLCPQGQLFCSTSTQQSQCNANGSGSTVQQTCAYGCDAATGQCKPCPASCTGKCNGAPDGCGGACTGSCGANQICQGQTCVGDPCSPDPCNGHGTCSGGTCTCSVPYAGTSCNSCGVGYKSDYPTCTPLCSAGTVNTITTGGFGFSALTWNGTKYGLAYQQSKDQFQALDGTGANVGSPTAMPTNGNTIGIAWSPTYSRFGQLSGAKFSCISAAGVIEGSLINLCGSGSTTCTGASIGSDGLGHFGVSWADDRTGDMRVYFNRVDANTCMLSQSDTTVSTVWGRAPAVAFGDMDYAVAWVDGANAVWVTRLDQFGSKIGDTMIGPGYTGAVTPTIAWNNAAYEWGVAWNDQTSSGPFNQIFFRRINESGVMPAGVIPMAYDHAYNVQLAASSSSYGLLWRDTGVVQASFVRLDASGTPTSSRVAVANANATGSIASNGTNWLVVLTPGQSRAITCQ